MPTLLSTLLQLVLGLFANSNTNCGAYGYTCQDGRTCSSGRCMPAWVEVSQTNAPTARDSADMQFLDGKAVVIGGCEVKGDRFNQPPAAETTGIYNPVTNTWSAGSTLNVRRAQFRSSLTDDGIYIFGGITNCYDGGAQTNSLELLPDLDPTSDWTTLGDTNLPAPRYSFGMTEMPNSDLFVYGGDASTQTSYGIFDPDTNDWYNADSPGSRTGIGNFIAFVDGSLVKIWGKTANWTYNPTTDAWATVNQIAGFNWDNSASNPPQFADDGTRVYLINSSNGHITWYNRTTGMWVEDNVATVPSGLKMNAMMTYIGNNEVFAWGGSDTGHLNFSNRGFRYQLPAPTSNCLLCGILF